MKKRRRENKTVADHSLDKVDAGLILGQKHYLGKQALALMDWV